MPLRIRDHLYWCDCIGFAVFLDANAGRYFALSPATNDAFLLLASGNSKPGDTLHLRPLIDRGMLVDGPDGGRIRMERASDPATHDFLGGAVTRLQPLEILHSLLWEMKAAWILRTCSFLQTVECASRRIARVRPLPNPGHSLGTIAAASVASSFITRSHDRCLVRALAVHLRCRRLGLASKLVFGVRPNPFAAHCWVQVGCAVVVGSFEQVRLFTPILTVP